MTKAWRSPGFLFEDIRLNSILELSLFVFWMNMKRFLTISVSYFIPGNQGIVPLLCPSQFFFY